MLFTIAVLSQTVEEAMIANEMLPQVPGYQKMFIFLSDDVDEKRLSWIRKPNFFFIIPKGTNRDVSSVAVRAGLILPSTLSTLFVKADEMPTPQEVMGGFKRLTREMLVVNDKFWGVRKEFVMLNGMENLPVFGDVNPVNPKRDFSQARSSGDWEANPEDVVKAITGEVASSKGIAQAIIDTVPVVRVFADIDDDVVSYLSARTTVSNLYDDKTTLYITDKIMDKLELLNSLNGKTFVMAVGDIDEIPQAVKPLRRFKADDKDYLILNSNIIQMLLNLKRKS